MKHLFLATLIALCLLAAPAALASSGPSGTYVTTVRSAGNLNGTYRITFHPGRFTLKRALRDDGPRHRLGARIADHVVGTRKLQVGGHLRMVDLRVAPDVPQGPRLLPQREGPYGPLPEARLTGAGRGSASGPDAHSY